MDRPCDLLGQPHVQRSLDDPREAFGPVVGTAGDQPHPVGITLHAKPVAVVFHFVQPVLAVRNGGRSGGEAEVKGSKNAKIGVGGGFCEPTLCGWVAKDYSVFPTISPT